MPQLRSPGFYIEELSGSAPPITGVATAITAFIGRALKGPVNEPTQIDSYQAFCSIFGGVWADLAMGYAVEDFFRNGGRQALIVRLCATGGANPVAGADTEGRPLDQAAFIGDRASCTGLYALEKADLFNLLCIPPDTRDGDVPPPVYQAALQYCVERRAMLIVDAPVTWNSKPFSVDSCRNNLNLLGLTGSTATNAAIYFPRVTKASSLQRRGLNGFVPCGIVAGIIARTDSERGIWKAPAGIHAAINGIQGFSVSLTDADSGRLNQMGVNCLRPYPGVGNVVWSARTLSVGSEYTYIPVRRTALYIEESIRRSIGWVAFEPNCAATWSQIRLSVGNFMNNLFQQGALQGRTPAEAYLVKCGQETTSQEDINQGYVNILIGFAPLKPAEFITIRIRQKC